MSPIRYLQFCDLLTRHSSAADTSMHFEHPPGQMDKRSYKQHGHTTGKDHMPEAHRKYQQGWDPNYFRRQAAAIGPATGLYVDKLLQSRQFSEQAYLACRDLLRLGKTYGQGRLEAACNRALQGDTYAYRIVNNILANNLYQQKLPGDNDTSFQLPSHDNLRGQTAFE